MPRISQFFGLVVSMYANEHGPPHFHVQHGEHQATFGLEGNVLRGSLSPRAERLVREWARGRRAELEDNWARARNHRPLVRIRPLK